MEATKSKATYTPALWDYLARSYSLIPLNGKKPFEDDWVKWCKAKRHYNPTEFENRNAGIACGPASNLLVLDVDDAVQFEKACTDKGWTVPETYTVESGGGGRHYYFEYPNDGRSYGNKAKRHYGFDLRGTGGQVVAPGSIHPDSGRPYRVIKDVPVAGCPTWILDLYEEPELKPIPQPIGAFSGNIDRLPIKPETKDLIRNGTAKGARSEAIMRVLNALVWSRLSDSDIYEIFEQYSIGEKYREKGEARRRWLEPQIAKARTAVCEFAEDRTFGTSSGRFQDTKKNYDNGSLDVSDVSDVSSNRNCSFLPAVPSFPVDIFPTTVQQAIDEYAAAYSVPTDIPAIAILSMAGACIGRTRGIMIKKGWVEFANTYLAIVGRSGSGKSPVIKAIQSPIFRWEAEWYKKYQEDLKAYQEAVKQYKGRKKDCAKGPSPKLPIYQQLIIDDSTTEALTDALSQNPRGILWNRDELSGLIIDLDKYTGKEGGTKARLLSAYDSGSWKVARVAPGRKQFIKSACLSIFGTIQEKALPVIFSSLDAATGFLPRFNFIRVEQDSPPLWSDEVVSEKSKALLESLFDALLRYFFVNGESVYIGVKKEAKDLFTDWFNDQASEPWADCDSATYEAVLAKLRGQCLRFALIIHCIKSFVEGVSEREPISADTMSKAIVLANYLKAHQKSIWQLCFNSSGVKIFKPYEKRVAEAIVALEEKIQDGMLPTQLIVDRMNKDMDERFRTSSRIVGKAFKGMGLETSHLPDKTSRGPKINPEYLERIKTAVGKRPKRPKRPSIGKNDENQLISNVRQTSQTSAVFDDEVEI